MTAPILRDLARAKALFQLITLKAILEAKPPEGQKHEKPVDGVAPL